MSKCLHLKDTKIQLFVRCEKKEEDVPFFFFFFFMRQAMLEISMQVNGD
jgi:hypothetical protein